MSEIQLFQEGGALPAYLKDAKSNLSEATFKGGGGKIISIKGGVWRMIVDGEQIAENEDRSMKFVVVNMSEAIGRTYYEGKYEAGKEAIPVCWSADGKIPSPKCSKPQANSCASCEQNIKGSGEGESRACRFIMSLAVVMENKMDGDVFRINIPAMSIFGKPEGNKMPFEAYRKFLKGHGIPLDAVVTEFKFDTKAAVPKLFFSPVRPLKEEEFKVCQEQGSDPDTIERVRLDFRDGIVTTANMQREQESFETGLPPAFQKTENPVKVDSGNSVEDAEVEEVETPKRRPKKQSEVAEDPKPVSAILGKWASDDDDDEE